MASDNDSVIATVDNILKGVSPENADSVALDATHKAIAGAGAPADPVPGLAPAASDPIPEQVPETPDITTGEDGRLKLAPPAATPPAPTSISTDDVSKLIAAQAAVLGAPQGAAPAPATAVEPPPLVTHSTLRDLGVDDPTDTQVNAFQEVLNQNAQAAAQVAQAGFEKITSPYLQQLEQLTTYVQEQQLQQARVTQLQDFYNEYPQLEQYKGIVDTVASGMSPNDSTGRPMSIETAKRSLAENVVNFINTNNLPVARGATGVTPTAEPAPRMATMAGVGASPNNGKVQPEPSAGARLWGRPG